MSRHVGLDVLSNGEDVTPPGGWECAICFELLLDPLRLPCRHAFCRGCLVGAFRRSRHTAAGPELRCPLCRAQLPAGFDPTVVVGEPGLVRILRQAFPQDYARREAQQADVASTRLQLRIGNRHEIVANPQRTKNGKHLNSHCWTMFVEQGDGPSSGLGEWAKAIESVKFKITPYFPSDPVLRKPPFTATRNGWGYFDVQVTVTFKAELQTEPLDVEHELCFDEGGAWELHEVELKRAPSVALARGVSPRPERRGSLPRVAAGRPQSARAAVMGRPQRRDADVAAQPRWR